METFLTQEITREDRLMVSKLKASPKLDQQKVVMVEVFSKSFASTSLKRTQLSSKISRKITKFAMKQSNVS